MITTLDVLLHGRLAGQVAIWGDAYRFRYDTEYASEQGAVPVSVSIPLDEGRDRHHMYEWMSGLLPDNEQVLRDWQEVVEEVHTTSPMDLLATRIGLDCAGAVQFCTQRNRQAVLSSAGGVLPLSHETIEEWCEGLSNSGQYWYGPDETADVAQFCLAGAQPKMAFHRLQDDRWGLAYGSVPSTHIIKPDVHPQFPGLVVSEYLSQTAARLLGLRAARTGLVLFGEHLCLVSERYDRQRMDDGTVRRVHQEDLCQALGFHPSQKYQQDGGPGPADISRVLPGEEDRLAFFEALVFAAMLVSPDGHAKNYSLLLRGEDVYLAPLYDVCSILPFVPRHDLIGNGRLAMRAGAAGFSVDETDDPDGWHRTAVMLNVDGSAAAERMGEMAAGISLAWDTALDELPEHVTPPAEMCCELGPAIKGRGSVYQRIAEQMSQSVG